MDQFIHTPSRVEAWMTGSWWGLRNCRFHLWFWSGYSASDQTAEFEEWGEHPDIPCGFSGAGLGQFRPSTYSR
jgi:hypothetical protein